MRTRFTPLLLATFLATTCPADEPAPAPRLASHWEIGPIAGAEQFPIALAGYSIVALRDQRQWKPGHASDATRFDGLEYRFDHARDRHIFNAARESYVPMLGGDCPVAYAETGERIVGQLEFGIVHQRRLIFFASAEHQQQFEADPARFENVDLVLGGRSAVSLIDNQRDVAGIPETVVIHRGLRYFFASEFERRIFLQDPGKYDGSGSRGVERPNQLTSDRSPPDANASDQPNEAAQPLAAAAPSDRPADEARDGTLGVVPALSGYCPVSLRQDGTWVRGRHEFRVQIGEMLFLAAGPKERELLSGDPATFVPALGGDCVVSFVNAHEHVRGSVFHAAEFDGRFFLFADAERKGEFKANTAKFVFADVAARGMCAVTLVDEQRETPGLAEFATWHDGKLYRFAGAAEKAKFLADLERYDEDAE